MRRCKPLFVCVCVPAPGRRNFFIVGGDTFLVLSEPLPNLQSF